MKSDAVAEAITSKENMRGDIRICEDKLIRFIFVTSLNV